MTLTSSKRFVATICDVRLWTFFQQLPVCSLKWIYGEGELRFMSFLCFSCRQPDSDCCVCYTDKHTFYFGLQRYSPNLIFQRYLLAPNLQLSGLHISSANGICRFCSQPCYLSFFDNRFILTRNLASIYSPLRIHSLLIVWGGGDGTGYEKVHSFLPLVKNLNIRHAWQQSFLQTRSISFFKETTTGKALRFIVFQNEGDTMRLFSPVWIRG